MSDEAAREQVDLLLSQAAWSICSVYEANISSHRGVAVGEVPLKRFADYILYVEDRAAGVIEAKKTGANLLGVETQSARYTTGLPDALPAWRQRLVFAYELTGVETRSDNGLETRRPQANRSSAK